MTRSARSWDWNDLEKSSSAWRVTLLDALGHELPPERVRIEKLPDAYEREFFPAKTSRRAFTKTYSDPLRRSPRSGEFAGVKSGALTLRIASPIGRLDLTWQA